MASYAQAGLSEVKFIFKDGDLRLLSYWGETTMAYEGRFNGVAVIKPQHLMTLAKKGAKMMPQPIPIKLTLDASRLVMIVDLIEIPAKIEVFPLTPAKVKIATRGATCVGITMTAGHLTNLIKQAFPGKPSKKEVIKFIAIDQELIVQSSRALARREVLIVGSGEWTTPAQVFRNVLDTFKASEMLTLEVDAKGLKLNSFSMPILTWRETDI